MPCGEKRIAAREPVLAGARRYVPVPKVLPEERLLFMPLPVPGLFRCVARYGYTDVVDQVSSAAEEHFSVPCCAPCLAPTLPEDVPERQGEP